MKLRILSILALSMIGNHVSAQSNTPCTAGSITAPNIAVGVACTMQAGTTVGSTQQTNAANGGTPSCGSMGPDVWYSFTAPASGSINIQTSAGSISDGVMALYSGTCGAFTQITCSDDAVGLMPAISAGGLTPGVTYLIRFWQYGGGTGTFNICVSAAAPAAGNTTCVIPSPICSGSPISFIANAGGSSADVINPGNNYTCLFTSPNPSWYYLEIATGGNLVIDVTAGSDVDYSIWGPFPNLANAIANCNSYGIPQDCSYSPSPIEQAVINGVVVGQVYVLLVTNFANVVQTININQALTNTASTNCAIVPLPVGYTQWDIQFQDRKAILTWSTDSEENNEQFFVQRSADGQIWETIGAVAGNGTSSQSHNYMYTDEKPLSGIGYYRLMQVDFNGTPSYTSILSVNAVKADKMAIYPNPAKQSFSVIMDTKNIEQVTITDPVGKMVEVTYTEMPNGITVDCSKLAIGIYTVTVLSQGTKQSERLVIKE